VGGSIIAGAILSGWYWSEALAERTHDTVLQARFATVAEQLADNEATIVAEQLAAQGKPVDLSGYYHLDWEKTTNAMRPSLTLNAIVELVPLWRRRRLIEKPEQAFAGW
jgi:monomeric isocitrate dehydrogenase